MYSPLLMGLIDILLAPDPRERSWVRIMDYNACIMQMQGSLDNVQEEDEEYTGDRKDVEHLPAFMNNSS